MINKLSYEIGKEYLETKQEKGWYQKDVSKIKKGPTAIILAKKYGISYRGVGHHIVLTKAIDIILKEFDNKEEIKDKIFDSNLNRNNILEISKMPTSEIKKNILLYLKNSTIENRNILEHIYFIKSENGLVKIGRTSHLLNRLSSLKNSSPCKISLIYSENGGLKKEKELHTLFKKYHHHGEWFKLSKEILDYIDFRNKK